MDNTRMTFTIEPEREDDWCLDDRLIDGKERSPL
jgi:hypothetical protein